MNESSKSSFPNTRSYNLIFIPQITRFLLEDAIISFKTDPHNGSKKKKKEKKKRNYGKIENNKTILKILSFIQVIYLNQQSSILWCFCWLKFEKKLFNIRFFSFIFRSNMIAHAAEKDQTKYVAQN